MQLVLADYIEDPNRIESRIRSHDHEHMFWLAEAAIILKPEGAVEALTECAESPADRHCGEICRSALHKASIVAGRFVGRMDSRHPRDRRFQRRHSWRWNPATDSVPAARASGCLL